ncbi:hypothetical protein TYRP_014984 [Tyrophagus putrescentiae]|nr:hypothetical protein TYRP_014984 [Tyrophagus putrescentiae]
METSNNRVYQRVYIATQLTGLLIFVLLLVVIIKCWGGIGFSKTTYFNFHPLLMVLGFVLLYSNTALLYRTGSGVQKRILKIAHSTLNGTISVLVTLALTAAVLAKGGVSADSHHFHMLHSWLGIATCILFVGQLFASFTAYLFPGASPHRRQAMMPYHRANGLLIFTLAVATCLTGLNQAAILTVPDYVIVHSWPGVLINVISLLLVVFASLTIFLLSRRQFRRVPLPSD